MDKELRERWIAALRSGQYHQGRGGLRFSAENGACKWCSLGVLLDVSGYGQWETDNTMVEGEWCYVTQEGQKNFIVLADKTLQQMGILVQAMDRLTGMNDREHASFADIATWIEEHL